jgi:hypothetical protein
MVEPCGEPNFADEPLGPERRGQLGGEHFEGDQPLVLQVPGEIDRGHPAPAELAIELIPGGEAVSKPLEAVVQAGLAKEVLQVTTALSGGPDAVVMVRLRGERPLDLLEYLDIRGIL